ncbi:MAG: hypothetical protein IT347_11015 [Candidatus Eisenbacteria bacterium]|nr:hypothetical protein [Candidatus Eisenbacteria bacterium]
MNRPAIILALVATFLIGGSLGLVSGLLMSWRFHRAPAWLEAGRAPGMRGRGDFGVPGGERGRRVIRRTLVMPRLREALELTDAQVARIEPLVEEAHRSMGAARDSLRARIERILTPEQRDRWRRLEARRRSHEDSRGSRDREIHTPPRSEGGQP